MAVSNSSSLTVAGPSVTSKALGDVVFGCTDTQGSRLALNWLAQTHYIPVIDVGVEIPIHGSRGGRVAVASPDDACLWCSGLIDESRLRAEQLPAGEREAQLAHGYIPDVDIPQPAVVSFNGIVASIAVTELLSRLGVRASTPHPTVLVYRHADGTVRRVAGGRGHCAMCTGPAAGAGERSRPPVVGATAVGP